MEKPRQIENTSKTYEPDDNEEESPDSTPTPSTQPSSKPVCVVKPRVVEKNSETQQQDSREQEGSSWSSNATSIGLGIAAAVGVLGALFAVKKISNNKNSKK